MADLAGRQKIQTSAEDSGGRQIANLLLQIKMCLT